MQKVIITKIFRTDKTKDGNPLISKNNKPYTKCNIQTQQHGEKWLSGFGNKVNEKWSNGDEVEIIITQNGDFLNYETPKVEDVQKHEIEVLKTQVAVLKNKVTTMENFLKTKFPQQKQHPLTTEPDIDSSEIPF